MLKKIFLYGLACVLINLGFYYFFALIFKEFPLFQILHFNIFQYTTRLIIAPLIETIPIAIFYAATKKLPGQKILVYAFSFLYTILYHSLGNPLLVLNNIPIAISFCLLSNLFFEENSKLHQKLFFTILAHFIWNALGLTYYKIINILVFQNYD